jgi:TRAP-type C4-dicarboxylate transport system substrate-binding protein
MSAVAWLAALGTSSHAQQVVTLKMANWVPPSHHLFESYNKLAAKVSELTHGTLKIEVDSTAVAKPGGMYDIIKNRVRDMAWDVTSYNPGLWETSRVVEMPFLVPDAGLASRAMYKWYWKHGFNQKEWGDKGVVLLNLYVGGGGHLFTAKHKVVKPDDAIGLKIRAAGPNEAVAKLIGAVPVSVPASQVQEVLQRGTAEGAFFSWDGILAYKLGQYTKYAFEAPGGLAAASFWVAINKEKFDSLSQAHKDALLKVWGADGSYLIGKKWGDVDLEGRKSAQDAGTEITVPDAALLKIWKDKLAPLPEAWIKAANARGLDGKALYDDFVKMLEEEQKIGHASN